jgi:gas vesicle protein
MLSTQLLREVDALQEMLMTSESGKQVDKKAVAEKTQLIRELARKIRKDQYLEFLDRRSDKDVSQGVQAETLGLAAVNQLRQWAVDLNSQLKGMYSEISTSTVSVQNLVQPSLEGLAKGIERMTKVIEDSSRKL